MPSTVELWEANYLGPRKPTLTFWTFQQISGRKLNVKSLATPGYAITRKYLDRDPFYVASKLEMAVILNVFQASHPTLRQ